MEENYGLYESAFNNAPIGMAMVSLDGQLLKVNEALCEMFGHSERELLQSTFEQLTYAEDLHQDWDIVKRMISGELTRASFEKRYLKKNGEVFWALLKVSISRDKKNIPQYFVSHIIDISEQKKSQMALLHNSKMIALGEMAGTIVHEINNPLAIIGLNASSIEEVIKEESINTQQISRFVGKIKDTVMRINDIIVSLRKLSGKSDRIELRSHDISEVINDALTFCYERLNSNGVKLETRIESFEVECRSVEISQVLINVLNNAYYAVKDVSNKFIEIKAYSKGDFGYIEISDSGTGVAEDMRARIMEPFFTSKPIGEGTGLGLSICKKIIESYRGSFYLLEDTNTTFVVKLPLLTTSHRDERSASL